MDSSESGSSENGMSGVVADSFVYSSDKIPHRLAGTSYSLEKTTANTFCGAEIPIEDRDSDCIQIPISLLDSSEICVECERQHQLIQHDRFNFAEDDGEHKYFFRVSIRVGEQRGMTSDEVFEADSVEEAKERIESEYEDAREIEYEYVARNDGPGEWTVFKDDTYDPADFSD